MRDIGRRIQRYRLSRYAQAERRRIPKWVWLALGAWILWAGLASDHSFVQLLRVERLSHHERDRLAETQVSLANANELARNPEARKREAEKRLREDEGWSRSEEIIFRIDDKGTVQGQGPK